MIGRRVKSRILILLISLLILSIVTFTVFKSLEKNVVYFLSPTEIKQNEDIDFEKKIRIGGLVKENSVVKNQNTIKFIVTDNKNEIVVSYVGLLPNLFSEGKGIVAEGKLQDRNYFIAEKILAKHDENYMPSEVYESLKIEASEN